MQVLAAAAQLHKRATEAAGLPSSTELGLPSDEAAVAFAGQVGPPAVCLQQERLPLLRLMFSWRKWCRLIDACGFTALQSRGLPADGG